jgi:alpha-glucosidase (family GH31 glycosyl hydrolase)
MGWHQCRWGYKNIRDLEVVQKSYKDHQIPLDTIWTDLDYMKNK